jgi:hypothetical protein
MLLAVTCRHLQGGNVHSEHPFLALVAYSILPSKGMPMQYALPREYLLECSRICIKPIALDLITPVKFSPHWSDSS